MLLIDENPAGFCKNKKRQAYYIAPLQPLTLAAFPPWEGSAGAGRVRPAAANVRANTVNGTVFFTTPL